MMFWLAFAIMAAFVVAFLFPAFFGAVRAEDDEEITTYFAQIDTIQSDADVPEEEAKAAVVALQKQILAKQEGGEGGLGVSKWGGGLTLGLLIIMAGIVYADQATFTALNPNDRPVTNAVEAPLASSPERQIYQNTQLRNLVAQLEQRLATDRANDPAGWQLYARSLITLGEYDRAISAYDTALAVSENDLDVLEERRQALEFIQSRRAAAEAERGPSAQDVIDAQSLSPEDRQAMIQGMVDSLAARLEAEPDNPTGWVRLIRARMVMGQAEQATADVETVRKTYAESPETIDQILKAVDWID